MQDTQAFKDKLARNIAELSDIMAALRHPQTGCPWDIEQTSKSIAHYTIEEAYEVVDAIEKDNPESLCDELGDVLLQVVFHARIAQEHQRFDLNAVIAGISHKMRRRHPHVFAEQDGQDLAPSRTTQSQGVAWEEQKARERAAKQSGKRPIGALDDVAAALPALMRAQKLQKRAARVGFDWPTAAEAAAKITEETVELLDASVSEDTAHVFEEAGDLLFSCVNVVRKLGVDAEAALRAANSKFTRRFESMEQSAHEAGQSLTDLDLNALDSLWDRVKKR
ncbi:MAG: nucleoside triphosphate pyrophosphohydrolase [Pseudomonadota bacterium]